MKKRKGVEAQRVKHPTQSRATGALIGDQEQNVKQKITERKKETGSGSPTKAEWVENAVIVREASVSSPGQSEPIKNLRT